jgi:hypothetical protein
MSLRSTTDDTVRSPIRAEPEAPRAGRSSAAFGCKAAGGDGGFLGAFGGEGGIRTRVRGLP